MDFKTINVDDNVNALFIDTDKFKTNVIGFLIRDKLDECTATKNALLAQILKSGCVKYPDMLSIVKKSEEMYGSVFDISIVKKGEEQIIFLYLEILNSDYTNKNFNEEALGFINEIFYNPLAGSGTFDEGIFKREKKSLEEKIKSKIDDKKEYAKIRCVEKMFKGESFSVYADGNLSDLEKIDNKSLYSHYKEVIKKNPIEILFTGNFNEEETLSSVKNIFNFSRGSTKELKHEENKIIVKKEKYIVENMDIMQGKLCMGYRTNLKHTGSDFYSMLVLTEILGGSSNSRLYSKVREKEGLCYYINSFVYRFKMAFMVQAGIDKNDFKKAVALIKEAIEEIKSSGIDTKEIEKAKGALKKIYGNLKDNQSGIMDFYVTQYCLKDSDDIDKFIKNIEEVHENRLKEVSETLVLDTVYFLSKE